MSKSPGLRGRVLILVQNLSVPFDRRVWLECQSLVDAGFRVAVVCPKAPGDPTYYRLNGVDLFKYRPYAPGGSSMSYVLEYVYSFLATLLLSLRASVGGRFSVIQSCNPPDLFWPIGLLFRVIHGSSFVFDHHDLCPELYQSRFPDGNPFIYRALRLMERCTARTADHVIATNDSYRQIVLERDGIAPACVTVIRTGPDLTRLRRTAAEPSLRRARPHLAAYLGVMGPQDGVDLVVEMADHVVHQLGRRDIGFTLIGSGDCFDELVALSHRLELIRLRHVHRANPRCGRGCHPFHSRCRHLAGSQESIERCLHDEQDDGVHGFRTAGRRVRLTRNPRLGSRRRCLRHPERGR